MAPEKAPAEMAPYVAIVFFLTLFPASGLGHVSWEFVLGQVFKNSLSGKGGRVWRQGCQ